MKKIEHQHHFDRYCAATSDNHLYDKVLVQYCRNCGKIKEVHFFPNPKVIKQLIKKGMCFHTEGKELLDIEYIPENLL